MSIQPFTDGGDRRDAFADLDQGTVATYLAVIPERVLNALELIRKFREACAEGTDPTDAANDLCVEMRNSLKGYCRQVMKVQTRFGQVGDFETPEDCAQNGMLLMKMPATAVTRRILHVPIFDQEQHHTLERYLKHEVAPQAVAAARKVLKKRERRNKNAGSDEPPDRERKTRPPRYYGAPYSFLDDDFDPPDSSGTSDIERIENADELRFLLKALKPWERLTVRLSYHESFSNAEIAEELGAKIGDPYGRNAEEVASKLSRARKKLRDLGRR